MTFFDIIHRFTQIFNWCYNMFYTMASNFQIYALQVMEIVNVLPDWLQYAAVGSLALTLLFMILRLV